MYVTNGPITLIVSLDAFNNIHNNIQFTLEKEDNNNINFLDITIHRLHTKLEHKIYRKPTSTSTIIRSTSCHPVEHKTMAFNSLYNRLSMYPLNKSNKNLEAKIIKQIAYKNSYFSNNTNLKKYNKYKKPTLWPMHNTQYFRYSLKQLRK
jgi:hypothetical protein